MKTIKQNILRLSGILLEDNASAYAEGIYKNCFNNGEFVSKSGIVFNNKRLSFNDNILNYDSAVEFANDVINSFIQKYPKLCTGNKLQSFEGTIRNLAIDYFNRRTTQ